MKDISKLLVVGLVLAFSLVNATLVKASLGLGSISGTVYFDITCNGLDLSDRPLANVSATLTSSLLGLPLKTKSDAQGNFRFSNLAYGLYALQVNAGPAYWALDYSSLYQISEVNGTISDSFVFCKK